MVTLIVVLLNGCASWSFEPRENTSCTQTDYVEDIVVTVSAPYLHQAIGLSVLVEKDGYTIVEYKSVPNLRTIDNVIYFPENCNQPLDIKTLGFGRVEKGIDEIVACADGV